MNSMNSVNGDGAENVCKRGTGRCVMAIVPRYLYIYLEIPSGFSALFERRNICSFGKMSNFLLIACYGFY